MVYKTQLTIKQQVYNKTPQGYGGYNLYLADERDPINYGSSASLTYFLTQQTLSAGAKIIIDRDEMLPLENGQNRGLIDGIKTYVEKPKDIKLTGYFRVVALLPAVAAYEEFSDVSIPMANHTLYQVRHFDEQGNQGHLLKVFSQISFLKGEDIPADETRKLNRLYPSEPPEYFLHDAGRFYARATRMLFTEMRLRG